jgi:steroid delta-isomerase-like uncharacterized protein
MSADKNSARARRFVLEHNQEDYLATFDDLLAPTCVVHEYVPGVPSAMDRTAYSHFIAAFRAAMPDIHNQVEDVIAEGDKVGVRWTGSGTHTGVSLMGVPAAGRQVMANGIYIFHFVDGKIVEIWNLWDAVNVMQQLGVIPAS